MWSKLPNSGVIPVASIREEARENHRNGTRRHHPVQPVLVAAGRGALLVEWLSVALQPLPAPLLAHPVLSILLSAALLRLLPPGLLLPVLAILRLLILPNGARAPWLNGSLPAGCFGTSPEACCRDNPAGGQSRSRHPPIRGAVV